MQVKHSHILIVDDNEDILMMLRAMLKHKGYAVSIKDNPENIESVVKDLSPDLILMDMLLSGADGCEICKRLKTDSRFTSIPIIMISAHPYAKADCLKAGADYFLDKPFEMNEILKTLENILA